MNNFKHGIVKALASLINHRKFAFWTVLAWIVICAVFFICFLTIQKIYNQPQDNSSIPTDEQGEVSSLVLSEDTQIKTSSEPFSLSSYTISIIPPSNTSSLAASQTLELSSELKQEAYKLLETVKQKNIFELRYYNQLEAIEIGTTAYCPYEMVKNSSPSKVVTDKNEIRNFIKYLRLNEWYPSKMGIRSVPSEAIYLDKDICISLYGKLSDSSWIAIKTTDQRAYFRVPVEIYDKLRSECRVSVASERLAYRLIDAFNKKEQSIIRYYKCTEISGFQENDFCTYAEIVDVPCLKEIEGKSNIKQIKKEWMLDEWKPMKMSRDVESEYLIYVDEYLHINLEGLVDGASWISINTEDVSANFVVPNNVYDIIKNECAQMKNIQ